MVPLDVRQALYGALFCLASLKKYTAHFNIKGSLDKKGNEADWMNTKGRGEHRHL